jgi:penicillin-binding protein 2
MLLFHRRIIALALIFVGVIGVLAYQAVQLTLVQGASRLEKAKGRLYHTQYLPTWRGEILDAKGRVLAQDVASFDIAIPWDIITGDRAETIASKHARKSVTSETWRAMSPDARQKMSNLFLPGQLAQLDDFWNFLSKRAGVPREDVDEQVMKIRKKVQKTAEVVWQRQEDAHNKRFGEIESFKQEPILEHRSAHVIFSAVDDETAMAFSQLSEQLNDAIKVQHARKRQYSETEHTIFIDRSTLPRDLRESRIDKIQLSGVADLLLGDIRSKVWAEDMKRRPFKNGHDLGGYLVGDEVGNRGLELTLESKLRGLRGRVVLDRLGQEIDRTPPIGGSSVQLTLDIELQARIEAILSPQTGLMTVQPWHNNKLDIGTPLRGAVVVLDANSGVLAMVSTPALRDEEDVDGYPWLNRAADGLYPAGSIIKPLVLAAALTEGLYTEGDEITCTGHYFENIKHAARCWIYREHYNFQTHGKIKAVDALARSCNIFFYELGTRLGFERLLNWYQKFGLTKPLSATLTGDSSSGSQGHYPSQEDILNWKSRGEIKFETISMAIGQGPITWTPLHAAAAYATLARGGIWKSPTILKQSEQEVVDLKLHQAGVRLAMNGLSDSISKEYGTGALLRYGPRDRDPIFNVDAVRLWGKTGTAEAPPYKVTSDGKTIKIKGLDHSWFVVMASHEDEIKPSVIVAVLIEHGGSGGRVAGPIANQVIHAIRNEGYLGGNR